MSVTRCATLDGTWELVPVIILQPVDAEGLSFTIQPDDVAHLLTMIDDEPGITEDGFQVRMRGVDDGQEQVVEFPPGEPARNAVAALRWFADAIHAAGPMPAT